MIPFKKQLLLFLLLLLFSNLQAQQYNFTKYNIEQGLPSQIRCMLQDRRGYIWFGTVGGGACRFDGKNFKHFTKTEGLQSNTIYSMLEDKNGTLWFGTSLGLDMFDGLKFMHYNIKEGESIGSISAVVKDKAGTLWVGSNKGLYKFDGEKLLKFTKLPSTPIKFLFADSKGNLWSSTSKGKGINKITKEILVHYGAANGFTDSEVLTINEDHKGSIWLGGADGAFQFRGEKFFRYKAFEKGFLTNNTITSIFEDNKHTMWFGSLKGATHVWGTIAVNRDSVFESIQYTDKNGLSQNRINIIFGDKNGNIWLGTEEGGACKFSEEAFVHFSEKDGLPKDPVESITEDFKNNIWLTSQGKVTRIANWYEGGKTVNKKNGFTDGSVKFIHPDKNGMLWFSVEGEGVYKYDGKSFSHYTEKDGLSGNTITAIYSDKQGNTWLCSAGKKGLIKYNQGQGTKTFSCEHNTENLFPTSIFKDSKNNIWLYANNVGLCKFHNQTLTKYSNKDLLLGNVTNYLEDNKGNIWMYGTDPGISKFDGNKFTKYSLKEHFTDENITAMVKDKSGNIWFATDGDGLYKYNGTSFTHYSEKEGLSNNTVVSLVLDESGNLWAGNKVGLNKFKLNYKKEEDIHIKQFGKTEGFAGIECNANASFKDSDGNLWFGTSSLLTRYNPDEDLPDTVPPVLHITGINLFFKEMGKVSDSVDPWHNVSFKPVLSYNQNQLTFEYIGINFRSPSNIVYRFMLAGLDKDWAPLTHKTEITYSNLAPGKYAFKVKACTSDGIWSKEPLSYSFTINSPWWKTSVFYCTSSLLFVGGIFSFIRLRERTLKREKRKLEIKVERRTHELAEKSKKLETAYTEIKDSINYAKRIQQAILPRTDLIYNALKDSFILYKPKAVVSGDFYGFIQREDHVIVATADCTGHGVPGALMSMIGSEQLAKIIVERGITQPAKILDALHTGIRYALKQDTTDGDTRDGMDITLCKIDLNTNILEYAGANRPLWIINPQRKEWPEKTRILGEGLGRSIVPDKQAIGGFQIDNRKPFTNHTIKLQKGDCIYTFSDGYADQFGGEKGKKFMLKNLERLLLEIYKLPMKEQEKILSERFESWMGNEEQVDDVLIIGVRV